MLTELHIRNFAIIEELDLYFESGLVTFTGETGAGKSIIIDAVETLLGGRAESTMVRSQADRAVVEAVFRLPEAIQKTLDTILEREELVDEPGYLMLSREIRTAGRNLARVNGRIVNTGLLREIGEYLVDVHGQSEHLSLLHVSKHIGLLDRYASSKPDYNIQEITRDYSIIYERLMKLKEELNNLLQTEQDAAQRAETLNFQVSEIESARLKIGEDADLQEERVRLANAEGLANLTHEALVALDEGEPEAPASIDLFGKATEAIEGLARLDPGLSSAHQTAQELFEGISELASNLRRYRDSIEFNPKRLDHVEERLALIQLLKRKYGESIPTILEFAKHAQKQLDSITHAEKHLEALQTEEIELLQELGRIGINLTNLRRTVARKLTTEIERELKDLQMDGANFKVKFSQNEELQGGAILPDGHRIAYYANGLDRSEFLIAPNPGEGFKPLTKIASGGETSRLMLALKNVLAQADQVPTLIFDEIDQGIGGRIGAIVGRKLRHLGRNHQVLCVTHLPQLAAYGQQHYHVEKQLQDDRTITKVTPLKDEARLIELAQMQGAVSEGTMQSARELMQSIKE